MRFKTGLISVAALSFPMIAFSGLLERELNATFEFRQVSASEYRLTWDGKPFALDLTPDHWLAPSAKLSSAEKQEFPWGALPYLQAVYELRFRGERPEVRTLFQSIEQKYPDATRDSLVAVTVRVCILKSDWKCVSELQALGLSPVQAGEVYFSLALGVSQGDWVAQKYNFELALTKDPQNPEIRFFAQLFSLYVAESFLGQYEAMLKKVWIYRPLGMIHLEKEGRNWESVAHETIFNSYHSMKMGVVGDELDAEWREQLRQLWQIRGVLAALRTTMDVYGKDVELKTLLKHPRRFEQLKYMASSVREVSGSRFMQELLERGIYSDAGKEQKGGPVPSVQDLGLKVETDFLELKMSTILMNQLNFLNFALFRFVHWFKEVPGHWIEHNAPFLADILRPLGLGGEHHHAHQMIQIHGHGARQMVNGSVLSSLLTPEGLKNLSKQIFRGIRLLPALAVGELTDGCAIVVFRSVSEAAKMSAGRLNHSDMDAIAKAVGSAPIPEVQLSY